LGKGGAEKEPPHQTDAEGQGHSQAAGKKAGRKYPNLVDNMNAAKKQRARRVKEN
jgi:hypothetical protein